MRRGVLTLVVAATVPIAGILTPGDSRLAAILGAVVVMLTGLRGVFHHRDNWTRFTVACHGIVAEIRLYRADAPPYDVPSTKQRNLLERVNAIESTETSGWVALKQAASEGGKPA